MNPLQTVRLAHCIDEPWRNGGGSTRVLLAWPSPADWALRLSVARIDRDGPFSAFAGVMRWFAVIEGAGVRLRWRSRETRIAAADPPVGFDGADAPDCSLVDGPTSDLNLMVSQRQGVGRLSRARPQQTWSCAAPWRGLYAAQPARLQRDGASTLQIGAGTLLWTPAASHEAWRLGGDAAAWWIEFEPRAAQRQAPDGP